MNLISICFISFYFTTHPTVQLPLYQGEYERMKKRSVLNVEGKPYLGENPRNQIGTENPIHMQGSSLRWDSNQGLQRCKT